MIFLDTNVISEIFQRAPDGRILDWLEQHDSEAVVSSMVLAELAYGVERIRPAERARRLENRLGEVKRRYAGRVYSFTEDAAYAFGAIMANAERIGRRMEVPDGIIASIALVNGGRLATRNLRDFETTNLDLISPWD